jgi:osmoprotectant transport system ATP-binding protein
VTPLKSKLAIELTGVVKRFGATTAVDNVSFSAAAGEICVLIGPSGCGKSTTLKLINRVVEPTSGQIRVRGEDVTHADPINLRRSIGYVIQHVGLFPHLTIAENIGIPLRLLGVDKHTRRERSAELLELVGLNVGMLERRPSELSGGQQQRVGVARALAADPDIVLMDEPFGAVDPLLRPQLQRELKDLQQRLRKTIVLVTHDLAEAFALADSIVLMNEGRMVQQGSPRELMLQPADPFVRRFLMDVRATDVLALMRLGDLPGGPAPSIPDAPRFPSDASLLDALDGLAGLENLPATVHVDAVEGGWGVPVAQIVDAVAAVLRRGGHT